MRTNKDRESIDEEDRVNFVVRKAVYPVATLQNKLPLMS